MSVEGSIQVALPFPIRGIDKAMPQTKQTPSTCPDLRNVRSRGPIGLRRGGGRRPGLQAAGLLGNAGGVINTIKAVARVPNTQAPSTEGALVPVVDDLLAIIKGQGGLSLGVNGLGNAYVMSRKRPDASWVAGPHSGRASPVHAFDGSGGGTTVLKLYTRGDKTYGDEGEVRMHINGRTGNDVLLYHLSRPFVTQNHDEEGCANIGPFVRMSPSKQQCICAYLEWTGTPHEVRLVIDKMDTTTVTRLAQSNPVQLMGWNGRVPGQRIRLTATANTLKAVLTWPGAAIGNANADLTVEVTNSDFAAFDGGGVIIRNPGAINTIKFLVRLEYSKRTTYVWPMVAEVIPAAFTAGANRYRIVAPFVASNDLLTTATPTLRGPADYAAAQVWPTVDRDDDVIVGPSTFNRNSNGAIYGYNTQPGAGTKLAVETRFRSTATSATPDTLCPIFELSANHRWFFRVECDRTFSVPDGQIKQCHFRRVRVRMVYNNGGSLSPDTVGTRTNVVISDDTDNADSPTTLPMPVVSTAAAIQWNWTRVGSTATLSLSQNGMTVYSKTINIEQNLSTTAFGTSAGVEPQGLTDLDAQVQTTAHSFRLLNVAPPAFTSVTAGLEVVAFTSAAVKVSSNLAAWSTATGTPPTGIVSAGFLSNKFYCLDGLTSTILDVALRTVSPWTGVSGTDWDRCKYVAIFRRRAYIARQPDKPSAWYCSRVNDPTDYNFGAPDPTAKAYLGTSPEIGQPGDEITGLIPWRDDYLLFGCRDSFWILRGDPGFGGRMDVLFRGCGLLTQDAHAFDHRGGLYFLAPGGLMYLAQGSSRPIEVARERLGNQLTNINLATVQPCMAFDVQRTLLYIYLTPITPINGTNNAVHVVYDPMSEEADVDGGAFLDEFATVGHQPRAVASVLSDSDTDRQVLIAGQDGVVRRFVDGQNTDDGSTIDAWIKFAPMEVGDGSARGMLHELQCTLNTGSGPVSWKLQGAASAVEVNALDIGSTGLSAGTWGATAAGFQQPVRLRYSAGALQVTLRQQTTGAAFELDRLVGVVSARGRRRVGA